MSDDPKQEREALEDGINGEFFRLLSQHMQREWGPGGIRYQQAVEAAAEDPNATVQLQKILHTSREIALLLRWPHERLQQLKAHAAPMVTGGSRRGPGL